MSDIQNDRNAEKTAAAYKRLYETIRTLRAPGGCPWDREQTPLTMRRDLIEETFEAVDAVSTGDAAHAKEELGDVILNASMIAYMYEQQNDFSVAEALDELTDKLIRRHPHVFPQSEGMSEVTEKVTTGEEVLNQWDRIKENVEGRKSVKTILDEVPEGFPPLLRAYKMQKKAAKKGFDWSDVSAVRAKVFEEIGEFEEALAGDKSYTVGNGDTPAAGSGVEADLLRHSEEEFGDILFALVNWARHLHIDPAVALERANAKFRKRFTYVENECRDRGIEMKKENLQTMDALWDEAKRTL